MKNINKYYQINFNIKGKLYIVYIYMNIHHKGVIYIYFSEI